MIRVGLNLLHARPEIGGGWNYIANVVSTLSLLSGRCHFVAYCTKHSAEMVPKSPDFEVRLIEFCTRGQSSRVLYEQTVLPVLAYRDKLDCMHWFANNMAMWGNIPAVVTMHDFLSVDRKSEFSLVKRLYLQRIAQYACKRARIVAPVSQTTAQAATRLYGVEQERIVVIPNPVDESFRPATPESVGEFRLRFHLPAEFWLYVAHPYAHKNHVRLFTAYKSFRECGQCTWPLVLRADEGRGTDILDELARQLCIRDYIVWLPRIASNEMAILYSAASVLFFPSLYEGCGIPVLEAMACGCPVAASDIPTTHEFAGDAALMFSPESHHEMVEVMRILATQPRLREQYADRGLLRAQRYSPARIAEKLLEAYTTAVSSDAVAH